MKTIFREVGAALFANGFSPIPIIKNDKMPIHKGWPTMTITKDTVSDWAKNSTGGCGVGLRCGEGIYGIDIDVTNVAMCNLIKAEFIARFGDAPCRVGLAPKCLLVYSGVNGMSKVNIPLKDKSGGTHKIEILGAGQQFVAYGIHKDTLKPYEWFGGELDNTEPWMLNVFNHEDFNYWFADVLKPKIESKGWSVISVSSAKTKHSGDEDSLAVAVAAQPLELSETEADAYLAAYPASNLDYDGWLSVGMALYHQSHGGWFQKWVDWSAINTAKFDVTLMPAKWRSFGGSANPVTMASIIYRVKAAGVEVSTGASWLEQIHACTDKHKLEQLVKTRISCDKSIGTVDMADLEAAVKVKFSEFGVVLRADPLRKLFKPKVRRALPDVGGNELPLETIGNLEAVCDNNDVVVRYNVIKKDDEILIRSASWSIDNAKSASITWLRSACHKVEMKTTNIKNFVTLLADSNQFNPVVEWVSSVPWDGVSRLEAFYGTVVEDSEQCSTDMKNLVLKTWMVSAIAAAFSPNGIMVRGVLVFQGEQYTGKTRWIDALAPKELELIKTGRALNVHDKDSVKQIVSCWISELGELDATFKKSDIAALKAFITTETDELRRPYAAAESLYPRRTVFAASVNEGKFLQDDTGNSRFWVLPIISMQHDHTLDMQQVWAEFHILWKNGEKHYLSVAEMQALNSHNVNFTAPEPIFEMIASHLDWDNFDVSTGQWMQVSDVLRWIGKDNPTRFESILAGKAIRKLSSSTPTRKSHGKQLVLVPKNKIELNFYEFEKIIEKGNQTYAPNDHIPF